MWDRTKSIKILRYYSVVAIVMCILFVMRANEYFPPVSAMAEPTMYYLQEKELSSPDAKEKEKIEQLIKYQKMAIRHDDHVSEVKTNIMILSAIFLFISVAIYILSTRELKK